MRAPACVFWADLTPFSRPKLDDDAAVDAAEAADLQQFEANLGPGCIVALHHRPSSSYQIRERIQCLYMYSSCRGSSVFLKR